jgi:RNase H-like domain found in reverse transcriptase
VQHLKLMLKKLRDHKLCAKMSKYDFGVIEVEYLGHIISSHGVAIDPHKIKAMKSWPEPTNVKQLRDFLGLIGYYRKFIKGYGAISKPFTNLLRKNSFKWDEESKSVFDQLKSAMCSAPVLAMPDFNKPFVLEIDASNKGIEVVLMQDHKPIAFLSKALGVKNQHLSTYEKEFLDLLTAVQKWRHYL